MEQDVKRGLLQEASLTAMEYDVGDFSTKGEALQRDGYRIL